MSVTGLSFVYPGAARPAFRGLDVEILAGRALTILGANGVGKSTLLRCLAGLARPSAGEVRIGDTKLSSLHDTARARFVAFVAQSEADVFNFTVQDVVLTGRAGHIGWLGRPGARDHARAKRALDMIGIGALARRSMLELSGGERQLVRLARALVQKSPILLLDEPTAHLDVAHQRHVLEIIRDLVAEDCIVVTSSHDPNHALACGGRVLALFPDGSPVLCTVEALLSSSRILERIYGAPFDISQTESGRWVTAPRYDFPPLTTRHRSSEL